MAFDGRILVADRHSDIATRIPNAPIPSAEQLRIKLLEEQMKEMELQDKARASAQKELSEFADDFLKSHISYNERAMIRGLVKNALEKGQLEAMVYSFPSDLCTGGGGRSTMPIRIGLTCCRARQKKCTTPSRRASNLKVTSARQ